MKVNLESHKVSNLFHPTTKKKYSFIPFHNSVLFGCPIINVYAHLMKSINREAPSKHGNTVFEKNVSKTIAKNKKEVIADAITS